MLDVEDDEIFEKPTRGLVAGPNMRYFRRRYFNMAEVARHNTADDLWVTYLGSVYNLTSLAKEHKGSVLMKPILEAAGQDISHWFDPSTGDIRTHIDPLTGCLKYYTPRGRFVHIPPQLPRSDWANDFGQPWWKQTQYEVGLLSSKTRLIRIINTLTSQEHKLEVGALESMWEILHRYLPYNAHAASYTWKFNGVNLDMDKTLEQNGIADEDQEFERLNMDPEMYTPALLLYFNDDLTEL
ncbi:cytochrome b5 domain-containing protein 1 isoform X1 [Dromiciops gliroides]|uniref:cytochrome b5 domain-containing protein 1 isoform X1 n=1 Tax=Dromiciops gliroides TaxID=33562 RepID=UPI001CC46E4C|nr:cytochrome b5 domain-containing protein 1 isoform X1 [Dromiciops gliroides]